MDESGSNRGLKRSSHAIGIKAHWSVAGFSAAIMCIAGERMLQRDRSKHEDTRVEEMKGTDLVTKERLQEGEQR